MAETKNTKAFYNAEIPGDWEFIPLGEVLKLTSGKTKPDKLFDEPFDENVYPVFGGNGIMGFASEFNSEGENILIGRVGEYCGITRFVDEKCWVTDNALYSKEFLKDIDAKYLAYKLQLEDLSRLRNKGGQPLISQGPISIHKVSLPKSLPEQRAIAAVLSTWDNAIEKLQTLIAQKELRKKWLMQQLLTGKKRLPAFANASAGKKGFGGEWKEMHLGDLFTERNETNFFALQLLSIGQNGVYPQDESIKKDTSNDDKSKYKRICPGDIGYNTMRMWQGRSALSELEGIVSPAYTVLTAKNNADSLFFSYLFKTPKMTNLFWRNSQGLVDDTLNCKFKDFSIIKVLLPHSKVEQTAIAKVLQAADKEIELLKAKAEKLKEQKKGLMQVLLSGKKRLKQ